MRQQQELARAAARLRAAGRRTESITRSSLAEDDERRHLQPVDAVAQALVHDRGAGGAGRAAERASRARDRASSARRAPAGRRRGARRRAGAGRSERGSSGATTRVSSREARCSSGCRHDAPHVAGGDQPGRRDAARSPARPTAARARARSTTPPPIEWPATTCRATPSSSSVAAEVLGDLGQREPAARQLRRAAEAGQVDGDHAERAARAARRPRARPARTRRGREGTRAAGPPRRPRGRH